mmetsp:Transcript_22723/g.20205  ORF Transcript_22723/g.20205 Transcript_22723/m.20205 type:complete len:274 (-) Transcript_22723:24-845(-)
MKFLKPVKKEKVNREVKIMESVKDCPYVNSLVDVVKDKATNSPVIVNEYMDVSHSNFRGLYQTITPFETKYYVYKMLTSLYHVHSKGVMHRDIKPHNILINSHTRELKLIDWGLAEFYIPGKDYHPRVASRYFKGPELLVSYVYYHYSLDIWGLGCLISGIVFNREPFFKGKDNDDQLRKITQVLGTTDLYNYIKKYNIELTPALRRIIGNYSKKNWSGFINEKNKAFVSDEVLDLIDKMLVMDHNGRISASQALKHPYFDEVRDIVEEELKL